MRKEIREILLLLFFFVVAAVGMTFINSCSFMNDPSVLPDIIINDQPDTIPVDTIPIDTLPVDTIEVDTCTGYIEYTDPAFVGMYIKFDFPQDSFLWEGGGISSYDLGEVVSHITSLPFTYGSDSIGAWVIIEGTNNHQQFQLDIFTRTFIEPIYRELDISDTKTTCYSRIVDAKWYMGTGKQEIWATGMTPSEFKQNVNQYKSVDMFTFYGSNWPFPIYPIMCRELLKDCHAGRRYADLFFVPGQLEQTLIDSFGVGFANWDRVRTN